MPSQAWIEGRIAFFEERSDADNPYLSERERERLKDEWNTDAKDWDDGWCQAKEEDNEEDIC